MKEITDNLSEILYIGDDNNDLECMKVVKEAGGLIACPADASKEVRKIADYISIKNGGDGAVRDIIDNFIETKFIKKNGSTFSFD